MQYPVTPDGRYFVVRGRLWRTSNPSLDTVRRTELTRQLMAARRAVGVAKRTGNAVAMKAASAAVDTAKVSLGEPGLVRWTDGAPDFSRHIAEKTPYANWFAQLR